MHVEMVECIITRNCRNRMQEQNISTMVRYRNASSEQPPNEQNSSSLQEIKHHSDLNKILHLNRYQNAGREHLPRRTEFTPGTAGTEMNRQRW